MDTASLQERYSRQMRVPQVGESGQACLGSAAALIVGCGALGSMQAELLARMGIGRLRLIDRDTVEWSNLSRQVLFTEADANDGAPKAIAAARRLKAINSAVRTEALVQTLDATTVGNCLEGIDVVLDGTDNFPTRYALNDACVRQGVPWVYAGVAGTTAMVLPVRPTGGPCLRCLFREPPPEAAVSTCRTEGVLATTVAAAVAHQVTLACQFILGVPPRGELLHLDLWSSRCRPLRLAAVPDCPCCQRRDFAFLAAPPQVVAESVCGQDAVRLAPAFWGTIGVVPGAAVAALSAAGLAVRDLGLLREAQLEGWRLCLYPDGQVMVHGCSDPEAAVRGLSERLRSQGETSRHPCGVPDVPPSADGGCSHSAQGGSRNG